MAVEVMAIKEAARRTLVSVAALIILKALRRIDIPLVVVAQPAAQVTHMGANPLARQGDEVLGCAILAVGHDRVWLMGCVLLVLREQIWQLRPIIADASSGLDGGDDSGFVIQGPVTLVTWVTLATRVESVCSLFPSISPASRHCSTLWRKSWVNTSAPQRRRALLSTLWLGISSSRL
jgi:hypothetical protein